MKVLHDSLSLTSQIKTGLKLAKSESNYLKNPRAFVTGVFIQNPSIQYVSEGLPAK